LDNLNAGSIINFRQILVEDINHIMIRSKNFVRAMILTKSAVDQLTEDKDFNMILLRE
jgi:hypothetical protein